MKMRLGLLLTAFVLLPACVTSKERIEYVSYAATMGEVQKFMGEPDRRIPPSELELGPDREDWIYMTEGKRCIVSFKLGRVLQRPACTTEDRKREVKELEEIRDPQIKARAREQEKKDRLKKEQEERLERKYYRRRDPR